MPSETSLALANARLREALEAMQRGGRYRETNALADAALSTPLTYHEREAALLLRAVATIRAAKFWFYDSDGDCRSCGLARHDQGCDVGNLESALDELDALRKEASGCPVCGGAFDYGPHGAFCRSCSNHIGGGT